VSLKYEPASVPQALRDCHVELRSEEYRAGLFLKMQEDTTAWDDRVEEVRPLVLEGP